MRWVHSLGSRVSKNVLISEKNCLNRRVYVVKKLLHSLQYLGNWGHIRSKTCKLWCDFDMSCSI